jgi:hypothetical protein
MNNIVKAAVVTTKDGISDGKRRSAISGFIRTAMSWMKVD